MAVVAVPAANETIVSDPRMKAMADETPVCGKRMIYGDLIPIVEA